MPTIVTTAALGNWGANVCLEYLLRQQGQLWLALHLSDPSGPVPNEVTGGGYLRQRIAFAAPSGRACVSSNKQIFTDMPVDSIPWLGVWTDVSSGFLALGMDIHTDPLVTTDSGQVLVAPGDVAFAF